MKKASIFVATVFACTVPVACIAQEEEDDQDEPIAFVYATYNGNEIDLNP